MRLGNSRIQMWAGNSTKNSIHESRAHHRVKIINTSARNYLWACVSCREVSTSRPKRKWGDSVPVAMVVAVGSASWALESLFAWHSPSGEKALHVAFVLYSSGIHHCIVGVFLKLPPGEALLDLAKRHESKLITVNHSYTDVTATLKYTDI